MKHHEITPEQSRELKDKGFLLIPNAIPISLLSKWQDLLTALNENALKSYSKSSQSPNASFIVGPDKPLLSRVNDLLAFYPDAVLDLLASPIMIAIARDICGPDAVPLQCDALFKHNHPESKISWHQDALHPRKFPYLNVGIYLDDAPLGDGCVHYIPKSQHKKQNIGKLVSQYGWNIPDMVKVPVKAGAILIQDMMVIHGSQMKRDPGVRRTIYVEMRPATAVSDHGVQSREWMELRKRWMGIVVRRSSVKWPEDSYTALTKDLKSDSEEIEEILRLREPPIPANYSI
ncbi:phytanoyl-CoA dioxygenase family protein [Lacinutrix sp. Hel_I_90]|uniref:phytanoyl-CoA dioxygenase family protein n=1 Tax=Lacinutrix sp. Hel_I_90 TaxID=1249999 RepID=UPI0005C97CCF|nr:phytanoyl-CoA dioxygenase family protein [Lacinutrix sp. Hel_I_90]